MCTGWSEQIEDDGVVESLWFLIGVAFTIILIAISFIIVDYCKLKEFKECFDTSFDSVECKKYLNY